MTKATPGRIKSLTLWNTNLPAQHHFYTQVLGLPLAGPAEPHQFTLQTGRSQLAFVQANEGENGRYHFAFNIPPNQFDEAKQWLTGRVPLIRDEQGADQFHFRAWNAHACYFYDPAGNILEFIARHDLPDQSDLLVPRSTWNALQSDLLVPRSTWNALPLLEISEIGLATDNVPATAALFRTTLGLQPYRGSISDVFTAVGDEHGLLIIVQQGRVWFPNTGVVAELYPIHALLLGENGTTYQLSGPPYSVMSLGKIPNQLLGYNIEP